jgi:hypothetical protein
MLDYCDDSNGSVGYIMNQGVNTIEYAINARIELTAKEQKRLFDVILKEAMKEHYNGWSDWRFGLLKICTLFTQENDLWKKLEKQLESLEQKAGTSWSDEFDKTQIKLLQLVIIERCEGPEAARKFIYENLHHSDFREKAIQLEFEKGDYEKVIQLCLDGEDVDQGTRPGLVKQWKDHRYKAYVLLGDIEKQRQLALELLFQGEFSYYAKLKGLYKQNEWGEIQSIIIERYKKQPFQERVYLEVLKEENMAAYILEFCKKRIYYIKEL